MKTNNDTLNAIQTMVDSAVNKAGYDKTRNAVVIARNANNTYKIKMDGIEYDNVICYGTGEAEKGEVVKVVIPNNQPSQMYILIINTTLIGEMKMWASNNIPVGWLLCDGTEVSKTSYPKLYNVIGDLWGVASDDEHFKLPNMIGRAGIGASSNDWVFVALEGSTFKIGTPTVARWGSGSSWYQKTLQAGTYTANTATFDNQDPASGTVKQVELRLDVGASGGDEYHTLVLNEIPSHTHTYTRSNTASWKTGTNGTAHTWCTTVSSGIATSAVGGSKPHTNMSPFAAIQYIICAM